MSRRSSSCSGAGEGAGAHSHADAAAAAAAAARRRRRRSRHVHEVALGDAAVGARQCDGLGRALLEVEDHVAEERAGADLRPREVQGEFLEHEPDARVGHKVEVDVKGGRPHRQEVLRPAPLVAGHPGLVDLPLLLLRLDRRGRAEVVLRLGRRVLRVQPPVHLGHVLREVVGPPGGPRAAQRRGLGLNRDAGTNNPGHGQAGREGAGARGPVCVRHWVRRATFARECRRTPGKPAAAVGVLVVHGSAGGARGEGRD